jgi:hypothetical protein
VRRAVAAGAVGVLGLLGGVRAAVAQETTTTVAAQAPAVTVTPDSDLTDLMVVDVDGTGYTPDATVGVAQCQLLDGGVAGVCFGATRLDVATDSSGAFATAFVVRRVIAEAGVSVDCATQSCGVATSQAAQPTVVVPVTFSAAVPPSLPTLLVVPDTDLVDGTAVDVRGTGFTPERAVRVAQCRAGGVGLAGCDLTQSVLVTSDADGTFALTFVVRADIVATGDQGGPVACRPATGDAPAPCALVAANDAAASEFASAALDLAAVPADPDELPRTGGSGRAAVAAAFVGAGALLVAIGRHRRAA